MIIENIFAIPYNTTTTTTYNTVKGPSVVPQIKAPSNSKVDWIKQKTKKMSSHTHDCDKCTVKEVNKKKENPPYDGKYIFSDLSRAFLY